MYNIALLRHKHKKIGCQEAQCLFIWGWGFAQVWRTFLFVPFFSGFHFPDKRNVRTGFCALIFSAQIFAPIFAQMFGAQIFARIFCRFSSTFWRLQNTVMCSRVTQKCAEKAAASEWHCSRGYPIPCPLSRADTTSHNRC